MAHFSSDSKEPREIVKLVTISAAAGVHAINLFKLHSTVRVLDQYAELMEVTTLTNCTNVYATLYDGTVSLDLTADGATLSGAPVGTVFTKNLELTQPFSVHMADQCRVTEVTHDKYVGKPFLITQKNGVDTFIRMHLTTTDNPVSFKMLLRFVYEPLDGGYLEILV